ncbi:MAG: hypothetical protein ACFFD4_18370 [Candidatus Odinarchaeota archaeon]
MILDGKTDPEDYRRELARRRKESREMEKAMDREWINSRVGNGKRW